MAQHTTGSGAFHPGNWLGQFSFGDDDEDDADSYIALHAALWSE